jgi:glycosyltransferase involved in cell wall biosynthesis
LATDPPALAHFHNTFPLISPAAYFACRRAEVPVVQTLHNYRLLCPAATLLRNGRPCAECLHRSFAWPGVLHSCYRGSLLQTAMVAAMMVLHRALGSWEKVDAFIVMNNFCRDKFIKGGLPAGKIFIKPHFVWPDPGERPQPGDYALFVGRLSEEKGVRLLLKAWLRIVELPLVIVGDGPLKQEVDCAAGSAGRIRLLGWRPAQDVVRIMRGARFLVFPSLWPEPFGRVIIEAFACGLPVLATRAGAPGEMVHDGRTGLLFSPGDPAELAEKAAWLWAHRKQGRAMGSEARREFLEHYTAEQNYRRLLEIYSIVLGRAAGDRG